MEGVDVGYICWGCMLANFKANFICMLVADIFFFTNMQQFFFSEVGYIFWALS